MHQVFGFFVQQAKPPGAAEISEHLISVGVDARVASTVQRDFFTIVASGVSRTSIREGSQWADGYLHELAALIAEQGV